MREEEVEGGGLILFMCERSVCPFVRRALKPFAEGRSIPCR